MSTLAFSDTTTGQGIIQACETNCALGKSGISAQTTTSLPEFTRIINATNSTIWSWIFFSYGGMQYDDSNQTDLPFATDTLTANKKIYAQPSTAQAIKGVSFLNGGLYVPLKAITHEQILQAGFTIDSFMNTASTPQYYMPVGSSIYVFPASSTTVSVGWKVYYDREAIAFTATGNDTRTPGFVSAYHDAVPTGASLKWLKVYNAASPNIPGLERDWQDYEFRIKKHYRQQYEQLYPPRIRVNDASREAI